ncbi:MAG: class I SAM-dependent methyltransferase [Candidatus Kerfeldbacteria bacterium]|nr:class I SAM-dependent methyltransferase [Candidatus Kerfeldbacteria bacterium]
MLYGDAGWEKSWKSFEDSGNIGITHVTNPALFKEIDKALSEQTNATLLDIGAGSNSLALSFLYEKKGRTQLVDTWISVEGSKELIRESKKNIEEHDTDEKISLIPHHVEAANPLPLEDHSIDIALSRHMLMHLSTIDLHAHMKDLRRVLKSNGVYIAAILNPEYEQWKRAQAGEVVLINDQQYEYSFLPKEAPGNHTFIQHFKDRSTLEKIFSESFTIKKITECFPVSDEFKKTHARYYMKDTPMTLVYVLQPLP